MPTIEKLTEKVRRARSESEDQNADPNYAQRAVQRARPAAKQGRAAAAAAARLARRHGGLSVDDRRTSSPKDHEETLSRAKDAAELRDPIGASLEPMGDPGRMRNLATAGSMQPARPAERQRRPDDTEARREGSRTESRGREPGEESMEQLLLFGNQPDAEEDRQGEIDPFGLTGGWF